MNRKFLYLPAFLVLSLALAVGTEAHVGHDKKEAAESEAPAAQESIYGTGETPEASEPEGLGSGSPFSRTDLSGKEPALPDGDLPEAEHGEPIMPQVKIAQHSMNPPSRKGYGVAVGITVLSGLGFGLLTLKRPRD